MSFTIAISDLRHSFADGWDALNGVTLNLAEGEYVALIGPNGSGKSTLAKHLNGLLKPTSGTVLIGDRDTRHHSVTDLARTVGYVFQNPDHQIFCPTVREELAFGPNALGLEADVVQAQVEAELASFGLTELADTPPATLPIGFRRKVALAAVLASRPSVLILDEPTAGLDADEQTALEGRLEAYCALGNTIILISHDLAAVLRLTERALLLHAGQLMADGPPSRVLYDAKALQAAGMQPPTLARLAAALADLGMPQEALTPHALAQAYRALREGRP